MSPPRPHQLIAVRGRRPIVSSRGAAIRQARRKHARIRTSYFSVIPERIDLTKSETTNRIHDGRSGAEVATQVQEADLKQELLLLQELLGDTRVRFRRGKTQFASARKLIDIDAEIRNALARPLSAELQLDVRRLLERLRALDPH
jgi:hypothetical protein